jgi:hypothetical protein
MFVNLRTIIKTVASSDPPQDVADVVKQLKPLDVFGLSFTQDGESARANITLTFAD